MKFEFGDLVTLRENADQRFLIDRLAGHMPIRQLCLIGHGDCGVILEQPYDKANPIASSASSYWVRALFKGNVGYVDRTLLVRLRAHAGDS